jgi:glucosyltransferase
MNKKIQIVTPVYNEEKNIEYTIVSFFDKFSNYSFDLEFIVSEDGSSDNSVSVIKALSKKYKVILFSSKERKNYTDSVLFGLTKATSELVAFVDSDGQYDPTDLLRMYSKLKKGTFVLGFRSPRSDSFFRLSISKSFWVIYKLMLRLNLADPSSGYFIGYKDDVDKVLNNFQKGYLKEGFWWEFYARAHYLGIEIIEEPVKHFDRKYGNTVVFQIKRLPKIAFSNIVGLFKLRKDLIK